MGKLCFSFPYCNNSNNIRFLVHSVQINLIVPLEWAAVDETVDAVKDHVREEKARGPFLTSPPPLLHHCLSSFRYLSISLIPPLPLLVRSISSSDASSRNKMAIPNWARELAKEVLSTTSITITFGNLKIEKK